MRKLALILTAAAVLAGCSWETYTNESGRTAVRQKYNQFRPERRAVQSHQADHAEHGERGQHWQKPQFANQQPATE